MLQSTVPLELGPRPLLATIGSYVRLTKPRVIELLLVTAVPPMVLAQQGMPPLGLIAAVVVGGALAAGGANTINCWIERDRDQLMQRTLKRPLPHGEIVPARALAFGIILNVLAFALLASAANLLAATLTLSATLFYVFVYTLWLKPRTVQNIVIGGAAGAVPALVGWAAVRNGLGSPRMVAVRDRLLLDPGALLGARVEVPRRLRGGRRADVARRARRRADHASNRGVRDDHRRADVRDDAHRRRRSCVRSRGLRPRCGVRRAARSRSCANRRRNGRSASSRGRTSI